VKGKRESFPLVEREKGNWRGWVFGCVPTSLPERARRHARHETKRFPGWSPTNLRSYYNLLYFKGQQQCLGATCAMYIGFISLSPSLRQTGKTYQFKNCKKYAATALSTHMWNIYEAHVNHLWTDYSRIYSIVVVHVLVTKSPQNDNFGAQLDKQHHSVSICWFVVVVYPMWWIYVVYMLVILCNCHSNWSEFHIVSLCLICWPIATIRP